VDPQEIESFTKELGDVIEKLGDKYIAFMREKWQHDVSIQNAVGGGFSLEGVCQHGRWPIPGPAGGSNRPPGALN
jgi:hypothetical protein